MVYLYDMDWVIHIDVRGTIVSTFGSGPDGCRIVAPLGSVLSFRHGGLDSDKQPRCSHKEMPKFEMSYLSPDISYLIAPCKHHVLVTNTKERIGIYYDPKAGSPVITRWYPGLKRPETMWARLLEDLLG